MALRRKTVNNKLRVRRAPETKLNSLVKSQIAKAIVNAKKAKEVDCTLHFYRCYCQISRVKRF